MTKMEEDQNGRQQKWKTTKMEDNKIGRQTSKMRKVMQESSFRRIHFVCYCRIGTNRLTKLFTLNQFSFFNELYYLKNMFLLVSRK